MTDRERFEKSVLPHLDAGYNLARWLARDAHDAADVVQEACLRALQYDRGLRPAQARAWFLTIVRHAFYDWCRAYRPAQRIDDGAAHLEALADPAALDPEAAASRKAEARELAAAIESLPLVYREAWILRELEELSYVQIARITGVPAGTVMSRLARARALLQRQLLAPAERKEAP